MNEELVRQMVTRSKRRAGIVSVGAALLMTTVGCGATSHAGGGNPDSGLKLGYMVPQTGAEAFYGATDVAAINLAVSEINKAGGVNGKAVEVVGEDEGGDPTIAGQAADNLIRQRVNAIVGPQESSVALSVIDKIAGAGVGQCTGSATSPLLSNYASNGYFFRTIPSDDLSGQTLGDVIAKDRVKRIVLIARNDAYGVNLARATGESLKRNGVTTEQINYDPNATSFDAEVAKAKAFHPDGVAVFSFSEGTKLLQQLVTAGLGPQHVHLYGTDGLNLQGLPHAVDPSNPNVLNGMKVIEADSSSDQNFVNALQEAGNGKLQSVLFGSYYYSCVNVIALAAQAAGSSSASDFKSQFAAVTTGQNRCDSYAECLALLAHGKTIAYEGPSGMIDLHNGDPTKGRYAIEAYDSAGNLNSIKTVDAAS